MLAKNAAGPPFKNASSTAFIEVNPGVSCSAVIAAAPAKVSFSVFAVVAITYQTMIYVQFAAIQVEKKTSFVW